MVAAGGFGAKPGEFGAAAGGFGAVAQPAAGGFGASLGAQPGGFGASAQMQGTQQGQWRPTQVANTAGKAADNYQSITAMGEYGAGAEKQQGGYGDLSFEVLRLVDYGVLGKCAVAAGGAGGFGAAAGGFGGLGAAPVTDGFGAAAGGFGAGAAAGGFGAKPTAGGFGAAAGGAFGAAQPAGGGFGGRFGAPAAGTVNLWSEHKDAQGRLYYHNALASKTQWDRPAAFTAVPAPPPATASAAAGFEMASTTSAATAARSLGTPAAGAGLPFAPATVSS